jgi:hypothetical protein
MWPSDPSDLLLTRKSKNGSDQFCSVSMVNFVWMDIVTMFQEFLELLFSMRPYKKCVIHISVPVGGLPNC